MIEQRVNNYKIFAERFPTFQIGQETEGLQSSIMISPVSDAFTKNYQLKES